MSKYTVFLAAMIAAGPAVAQDTRELDAHEHGVTELNLAFAGDQIAIELHAPGFDIVGFEYEAESDSDLAAVDAALAALADPLSLFVMPETAGCSVTLAEAALVRDEHDHDHDDHAHEDHEDHADEEHGDHNEHAHGEHAHEEASGEASHSEFEAEYLLTCADVGAIDQVTMAFFDRFESAGELEIVVFTTSGAQSFEVSREARVLDLSDAF